jgi:hypothetical protein
MLDFASSEHATDDNYSCYQPRAKPVSKFSKSGLTRPRPSYFIPEYLKDKIEAGFPLKNSKSFGDEIELKWTRSRWHKSHYEINEIQDRSLTAAIYWRGVLASVIDISEIRNATDDFMTPSFFLYCCDAISQEYYNRADAINHARENLLDEADIMPKEAFVEISWLFITETAKQKNVWAEALNWLIATKYKNINYSLLLLNAVPLEYQFANDTISSSSEATLFARRTKALCRLYTSTLGVVPLYENRMGGSWMAKPINI